MNENEGDGQYRRSLDLQNETSSVAAFEGTIPEIAEKEKRGKKIKQSPDEPYVQELISNVAINIPSANR